MARLQQLLYELAQRGEIRPVVSEKIMLEDAISTFEGLDGQERLGRSVLVP